MQIKITEEKGLVITIDEPNLHFIVHVNKDKIEDYLLKNRNLGIVNPQYSGKIDAMKIAKIMREIGDAVSLFLQKNQNVWKK